MYCSNCGAQNSDGATYCVNCNSVLMDTPSQPSAGQIPSNYPVAPPGTYGLAVAAFVMGLLCMTCVLWPLLALPAIICSIIALVKISQSRGQLKGTGLAVAGLVIPVVMTFILPLVLAILMPAFSRAREKAQEAVCLVNLHTLAQAMMYYQNDYHAFPPPDEWCDRLIEDQNVAPQTFQCPRDPAETFAYAVNKNIYAAITTSRNPQMVLFFESDLGRNGIGGPEDVVFRHPQGNHPGCYVVFMDSHVQFVTEDRIADLQWTAE